MGGLGSGHMLSIVDVTAFHQVAGFLFALKNDAGCQFVFRHGDSLVEQGFVGDNAAGLYPAGG